MITNLPSHSRRKLTLLILLALLLSLSLPIVAHAQSAQVQVVLFYSPFCGHCQQVISEGLPPIVQTYNTSFVWSYFGDPPDEETGQSPALVAFEGDTLQVLYVDTTTQVGNDLYTAAVERYQIAPENQVVPIMVVGDELLIGGIDIPGRLPGLVDTWLIEGGLPWPDIPGLEEIVTALVLFPDQVQGTTTQEPGGSPANTPSPAQDPDPSAAPEQSPSFEFDVSKLSVTERIQLDPVGNSISIVVLIGMLFSLVGAAMRWRLKDSSRPARPLPITIPALILAGLVIASYLSFVETTGTEAVCGPVGDCNTVQTSEYAQLFGFIPVGYLGLFGYVGMLVAWFLARRGSSSLTNYASLALFGMALIGSAFSIYLTFLEPFVIGATCMWCISSAIIITIIMLLSVDRARHIYTSWRS